MISFPMEQYERGAFSLLPTAQELGITSKLFISIWAQTPNGYIGLKNSLPWLVRGEKVKTDYQWFLNTAGAGKNYFLRPIIHGLPTFHIGDTWVKHGSYILSSRCEQSIYADWIGNLRAAGFSDDDIVARFGLDAFPMSLPSNVRVIKPDDVGLLTPETDFPGLPIESDHILINGGGVVYNWFMKERLNHFIIVTRIYQDETDMDIETIKSRVNRPEDFGYFVWKQSDVLEADGVDNTLSMQFFIYARDDLRDKLVIQ
eukprot:TRINITY_DN9752_c0_g1_i1.p1 TRINITY_DN9752_c0_g1~~TRINITY_DN9752_c0_g1_i1.p1  ORF type:complete len:293 (+),score=62.35 TRINITY_DN9752_c0_g1_i1:106-879(+)